MNNTFELRRRQRETVIIISFSIFSVLLIYATVAMGWSPIIIPVLAAEVAFVWWAYINGFRNYKVRAFIVTVFACISITFYGVQSENFLVVIPTLCVFAVLFSLYDIATVYYVVVVDSFFLLVYHIFIAQNKMFDGPKVEQERAMLQLVSYFVLLMLCVYRIRNSEQKDQDMEELEVEVNRTQKIKDDFVANTSHELRTPINTITGMSEILLQENLPEDIHREVLDIQMTGFELQTIVTDIMDYSALESKTLELNPRSYNITSTLNDVMNMTVFQNRDKNLELIFDCDPNIPRLLYGDEAQLRRVINNLIGNAIKFTNEGGVRVEVTYRPESYGVNLIVRIKDTGIGMDASQQERIFQSFYQADSNRNRRVEGMGLGLTISSELVKKMDGFLHVNSELGKGSEFSFTIPQRVDDERSCIEINNPSRIKAIWYYNIEEAKPSVRDDYLKHIKNISEYLKIFVYQCSSLAELKRRIKNNSFSHLIVGTEEYQEDPIFFDEIAEQMPVVLIAEREHVLPDNNRMHILYKPYNAMTLAELFNGGEILESPRKYVDTKQFVAPNAKVLVVDDNLMNLKVVEGLLRKYRIRITAASSGEEALNIIDGKDFDFVFMDHMMPGMDGIECLHAIRMKTGSYFQTVPIIALTANAIAGSREMFLSEGFNDFVAKPIDNIVLYDVLKKYIPLSKQLPVEENVVEEKKTISSDDLFAQMEGIDKKAGLTYCGGSVEDYIEMAGIYYETGKKYFEDLSRYHNAKDWKNYSILTHSIKSTSKTIGAMKLSDIAYKEEIASKEQDEITIEQYHDSLVKEYRRVLDMIGNNPHIIKETTNIENVERKDMDEASFTQFCDILHDKLETFEAGSIQEFVNEYRGYYYKDKDVTDIIESVMKEVGDFDFDGAVDALKGIQKEYRGK